MIHDYDTKLSAHELIMYRNGLQDFIIEGDCTAEERKKIRKEIYGLDLLIEVKTVQQHANGNRYVAISNYRK